MVFFIFLPILLSQFKHSLRDLFASTTDYFHHLCQNSIPNSAYLEINQALVCGENLKSIQIKQLFIESGLYHLIVVSGSHLVLLAAIIEIFFRRFQKNKKFPFLQLFTLTCFVVYSCMCQFQPPLVRSCFAQFILFFSQRHKLHLTDTMILFYSILLCLCFEPQWIDSMSLLLSSTASLSLILTRNSKSPFSQQLFIYLILFPLLYGWGNLHPLTVVVNILIAPIISFLLLPFAILTILFHFLTPILDFFYQWIFIALVHLSQPAQSFPMAFGQFKISILLIWLYFLSLTCGQYIFHLRKYRDSK